MRNLSIEDLLSVVGVQDPQISPDGRWVIYQARTTMLDENRYVHDLWLVPADGSRPPAQVTNEEPTLEWLLQFRARWAPDSSRLAYFPPGKGLTLLRLHDETLSRLDDAETSKPFLDEASGQVSDIRWSPDGTRIAFLSSDTPPEPEPPRSAVAIDIRKGSSIAAQQEMPSAALHILDIETRKVDRVTGDSLDVRSFDWSPGGDALVLSAKPTGTKGHYFETNLYILNLTSRAVRPLLEQPGGDTHPVWSPDGSAVAFWSQMGSAEWGWHYLATPAVVPVGGGSVAYPMADMLEDLISSPYEDVLRWSPDGGALVFSSYYNLTNHLFRIPVAGGVLERLTPDEDTWYDGFSFGGESIAYTKETLIDPPEIFVSDPEFVAPRRLTDANPSWRELALPSVRRTTHKSLDGRWEIPGVLLLPPGHTEGVPRPTLVEVMGGPSMVPMKFLNYMPFPQLVLASEGYSVYLPNTRGRGGFGVSFARAIELEGSFLDNPFGDVMAGVDMLVEQGIADPDAIGIMGHSYGGAMTAKVITKTDRFKVAAFHEGVVDFLHHLQMSIGDPVFRDHQRQQGGVGSPHEPEEFDRVIRESPLYEVRNITTPVLIEAGELALHDQAQMFAHALEYFGKPYAFYLYPRTGHVTTEPVLMIDEWKRKLDWFGFHLKGVARER